MSETGSEKACPAVWDTLYSFQQNGLLCDVRLQVQNGNSGTLETFAAHRLVLAASSAYFEHGIGNSNDWQEVYFLEGSDKESLTLVMKYIYRQVDYFALQSHPEALKTAEALQIIRHLDEECESETSTDQACQGHSNNSQDDDKVSSIERAQASNRMLTSVACQTNFENMLKSLNSSKKSKQAPRVSEQKSSPAGMKNHPVKSPQSRTEKPVRVESFVSDKVSPTQDDGSRVRRSSRTPKLSQKMKEYVSLKSDLTEVLDDVTELDARSEMVLSYKSPTVQVFTVQQSSDSPKTPLAKEVNVPTTSGITSPPSEEGKLKTVELQKNCDQTLTKTGDDASNTSGEVHDLFKCDKCPQLCATQSILDRHIHKIHSKPTKWVCQECKKEFLKQTHYINHMKQVHKKAPFECKECGLKFLAKSGFLYHKNRHHNDEVVLKFSCVECEKKFFLRSELTSHMMFKHSDERPFACELCHKAFKHKKDLHRHSKTYHSEDRNYECDECNRAFKTDRDLKKHQKLHERGTWSLSGRRFPDGLNYPCSFCNKTFTKRTQQKAHERLQHTLKNAGTSYLCTACNRSFAIKHYLMQHIKHVHMARQHQCNKCERMFMQNYDLRRHQTRCKGKMPTKKVFVCPNCNLSFSVKGNLTKHMKIPGRCKWQRNNISDLVVLVQDNGAAQDNDDVAGITEETEIENGIPGDSAVIVQEVAINSEDASSCVMSFINAENEEVEMPVIMKCIDGEENVISISHYPGADLILEAVETPEATMETVIQMPMIQSETETVLVSEDVIDSHQIVIANGDDATFSVIAQTEIVTHPDTQ